MPILLLGNIIENSKERLSHPKKLTFTKTSINAKWLEKKVTQNLQDTRISRKVLDTTPGNQQTKLVKTMVGYNSVENPVGK